MKNGNVPYAKAIQQLRGQLVQPVAPSDFQTLKDVLDWLDMQRANLVEARDYMDRCEKYIALLVCHMAFNRGQLMFDKIGVTTLMQNITHGFFLSRIQLLSHDVKTIEKWLHKTLSISCS
jgi:hypothetical protein